MYGQVCNRNYANCTNVDVPLQIDRIYEFNTYGEAMLYKICQGGSTWLGMTNVAYPPQNVPDETPGYGVCDHLGLDRSKCQFRGLTPTPESCLDPDVIDKLAEAASDPLSFLNCPGYPDRDPDTDAILEFTSLGGLLLPKIEASTLAKLSKRTQFFAAHLQRGAPTKRANDFIAYPFREHAMLVEVVAAYEPDPELFVSTVLEDPNYNNDKNKMDVYYNYMVRENVKMYFFLQTEPGWQSQLARLLL